MAKKAAEKPSEGIAPKKTKQPTSSTKAKTKPTEVAAKAAVEETGAAAATEPKEVTTKKKTQSHAKNEKTVSQKKNCHIKSCKREYRAKGYCNVHYKKWRHGEYGRARYKLCQATECRQPMVRNHHGHCEEHYQSFYIKGAAAPKPVATAKPVPDKTPAAQTA